MTRLNAAGIACAIVMMTAATAVAQTPVEAGYRDFSFGTSGSSTPTGEKPESKLWFNDGSWWGSLFSPSAGHYRIHRFDSGSQAWTDTGTTLDTRASSKADVLWDDAGQKLYVASHLFTTSGSSTSTAGNWGKLFRYSYDAVTRTYSLDSGFPVSVTRGRSETLTLAKDGNGRLFVTYVESSKVKINWSLSNDADWGTPVDLPLPSVAITVSSDDISAIVSFPNGDVGLMWSNQRTDQILFSLHRLGDPPAEWQPVEVVLPGGTCGGNSCADDHISLKTDQSNRLYAATKTANGSTDEPLTMLSVRDNGTWSRHTIGLYQHHLTRGIIVLDEQQQLIYFIATTPESGGAIYYKTSPMNGISFEPGIGEPMIESSLDDRINNAASTKQSVSSLTGLLVIASDQDSDHYLHAFLPLGSEPATPPAAPVNLNAITVSSSRIAVIWTDASNNETVFRLERKTEGGAFVPWITLAANVTSFEDTDLAPSTTYTYRVFAQNAQGDSAYSNEASATTTSGGTAGDIKAITFESGTLTNATTGADAITGTVTIESAQPVIGTFSARIADGSSSFDELFPAANDLYLSVYLRLSALPASDARIILVTNSGANVGNIVLRTTGQLRLRADSTTVGSDSAALAVGETYRIGLRQRAGTGDTAVLEAFLASGDLLFGAPFASTTTGTWTSNADRVRFGPTTAVAINGVFDDARLDTSEMPGPSGANSNPPVPPQDPEAVALSPTEVRLTWVDAAKNETAVHLYRADNGGLFAPLTTLGPNTTSYNDLNLTPATNYAYRLRGENNGIFSDFSDTAFVTTPSNTTGPPAAPSSLDALASLPTHVIVTWTDNSDDEIAFHVERADSSMVFQEIGTSPGNTPDFSDETVEGGTTYHYRVRAGNANGFSAYSNVDQVTTPPAGSGAGGIKSMTFESGSLTDSADGADAVRGNSVSLETGAPLKGTTSARIAGTSSYLEESFTAQNDLYISFYLRLNAIPTSEVRLAQVTNAGSTVGNLLLKTNGQLKLRNGSTTIGSESAPLTVGVLYRIGLHQRTGPSGTAVLEAFLAAGDEPAGSPFANLATGTWLTPADRLRLGATTSAALDAVVDDVKLNSIAMPQPSGGGEPPASPPPAPTNPSATGVSTAEIHLSWEAGMTNAASFHVERAAPSAAFIEIAVLGAEARSYADAGLDPGTTYAYRIRARNGAGFSGYSATVSAETLPPGTSESLKVMTFEDGSVTHPDTGATFVTGPVAIESSTPLKGAYSARVTTGNSFLEQRFGPADNLYLSFYVRIDAMPTSDVRLALISNDGKSTGNIVLRSNGRLRLRVDGTTIGESAALVAGQVYRIGLRQRAGTGASAIAEGFVAAGDAEFGAPFAAVSTGSWTTHADRVRIGATTSTAAGLVIDEVRLDGGAMPGPTP
jgi:hypothetical protein